MVSTTKEKMEVMQAYLEGKTILTIPAIATHATWRVMEVEHGAEPAWNWYASDYRVKPEPKVIWVNEYKSEHDICHGSKEGAEEDAAPSCIRVAVEYREVLGAE
jgi:hypothetical protein